MISAEQLLGVMPLARKRVDVWLAPINNAMIEYGIDTPRRIAAFLAQIAHESGQLRYVRELASGEAYEGRLDLGNTQPGDGVRYKGRGLIQITGRHNYRQCSIALFGIAELLLGAPETLERPMHAARSAAWFWWSNGLNIAADCPDSFRVITRRINGGLNGYADRLAAFERAQRVIS